VSIVSSHAHGIDVQEASTASEPRMNLQQLNQVIAAQAGVDLPVRDHAVRQPGLELFHGPCVVW
jgi:hypothetical protein